MTSLGGESFSCLLFAIALSREWKATLIFRFVTYMVRHFSCWGQTTLLGKSCRRIPMRVREDLLNDIALLLGRGLSHVARPPVGEGSPPAAEGQPPTVGVIGAGCVENGMMGWRWEELVRVIALLLGRGLSHVARPPVGEGSPPVGEDYEYVLPAIEQALMHTLSTRSLLASCFLVYQCGRAEAMSSLYWCRECWQYSDVAGEICSNPGCVPSSVLSHQYACLRDRESTIPTFVFVAREGRSDRSCREVSDKHNRL